MAFDIHLTDLARSHIGRLRTFDQRMIVKKIEEQLEHEPDVGTRNRKLLKGVVPSFECEPPLWELRAGNFRVFYDIDPLNRFVSVRAVLKKDQGQTTEDILHEKSDS